MKIAIQVGRKDNIEKDFQMFSGTALVIRFSTKNNRRAQQTSDYF